MPFTAPPRCSARAGWSIDHLPVGADGRRARRGGGARARDHGRLADAANNETGVIQPVAELATRRARARGALVHCDAVQAAGKIPVDVAALGADYLVISAHKLGGPKGVGALIVRRGAPLEPLFRGSGHERGRRGGTENLPGIVGLRRGGRARGARARRPSRRGCATLRARFEHGLRSLCPDAVIHGAARRGSRTPSTCRSRRPQRPPADGARRARRSRSRPGAACASGAVEPSPGADRDGGAARARDVRAALLDRSHHDARPRSTRCSRRWPRRADAARAAGSRTTMERA